MVSVSTEEVTLGLDQVGRKPPAAIGVEEVQGRGHGRHRDPRLVGGRHHPAQGGMVLLPQRKEGLGEEEEREVRLLQEGLSD